MFPKIHYAPRNPNHRDREKPINLVRTTKSGSDIEETIFVVMRGVGNNITMYHRKLGPKLYWRSLKN